MSNPNENNVETKELTTSNSEAKGELTFDNDVIKKNYWSSFRKCSRITSS